MVSDVAHNPGKGTLFFCTSCSVSDKSGYRALSGHTVETNTALVWQWVLVSSGH